MKGILLLFLFFSLLFTAKGQTIRATGGGWSNSIAATTITTTGNNYSQNVTSGISQTFIDISPTTINWIVRINKMDTHWHNSLELYAKRVGNGFLTTATISGGTIFSIIQNTPVEFFRGTYSITSIPIQYEIRGLSVLIPADSYSTTIYYTISDN